MENEKRLAQNDCYCIDLRRASNAITAYYNEVMRRYGLTLNQYSIMANIREIEPCSVSALAKRVRLERTTLVRDLKPLLATGLIIDKAGPDKRDRAMCLTKDGVARVQRAKRGWIQAQSSIAESLGWNLLKSMLKALSIVEKSGL